MSTSITFELGPKQEAWLQIMETTELPQGSDALRKEGKYCCLGLAAELVLHAPTRFDHRGTTEFCLPRVGGSEGWFDSALADGSALGLHSGTGTAGGPSTLVSLAQLNDEGTPFDEIAKIIRQDPGIWFTRSV